MRQKLRMTTNPQHAFAASKVNAMLWFARDAEGLLELREGAGFAVAGGGEGRVGAANDGGRGRGSGDAVGCAVEIHVAGAGRDEVDEVAAVCVWGNGAVLLAGGD